MQANTYKGDGFLGRLLWVLAFKYRKTVLLLIIFAILFSTGIVISKFAVMKKKLKELSILEPIYVVGVNRDLKIGDVLSQSDLKPFLFYKKEFEKINNDNQGSDSFTLFSCQVNSQSGQIVTDHNLVGRVIKTPIYKNSFLREEHLAKPGSIPGLTNLLEGNETLVDIKVPQTGFNVFIKPLDLLYLYERNEVFITKARVILVDSKALGEAPLQVESDPKLTRHLTLALPEEKLRLVNQALQKNSLLITLKKSDFINEVNPISKKFKLNNQFQSLTMIHGDKKEVIIK